MCFCLGYAGTVTLMKLHVLCNLERHESKWRQQTLPAYRPILTGRLVLAIFLVQGILFIAIGVMIKLFDHSTYQKSFKGDVKFQYGIEYFNQNNRQYIKSRNDIQLTGDLQSTGDCGKYATSNESGVELPIAPCGLMANSMFNAVKDQSATSENISYLLDTFQLFYETKGVTVPFSSDNVIWSVERKRKFINPKYDKTKNETLCSAFEGTAKPLDWERPACELGNDEDGYAFENVDFIVWMKPAALPNFRKTYRTLKRSKTGVFTNGLPQGNYTLTVHYS
ncbi:unnamed protein product [Enterobius vermicularis]|uniref:Cell cycle control protein 50A n=1 Tax=Enterobius vermicularis TaxID=51028 RepID=A0A0N4V248_ENTVE|nr:unnamed protein product [Enterobius vermicularis]